MNSRFMIAVLMALTLVFSQLVSTSAMAASYGDGEAAAMVMSDSMDDMTDCPGMDMADHDQCPHSSDKSCCKHNVSCASTAMMSGTPSTLWFSGAKSDKFSLDRRDMASSWIELSTPPPKA